MGGGGKTTSTTGDKESRATTKMLREKVQRPLIEKLMPQWLALLSGKTGGSSLPIVQGSTNAIGQGTSASMSAIQAMLAKSGLTGTPYGNRIQAQTTQGGQQAKAAVGPNLAMDMWRLAPGMITGSSNTIVNANRGNSSTTTTPDQSGVWGEAAGNVAGSLAQTAMLYRMMNYNKPTTPEMGMNLDRFAAPRIGG